MTDYRDVQNPSHSRSYDYSTMGNQKSPLTGILIALAVIAVVFLGLFMLGGTSTSVASPLMFSLNRAISPPGLSEHS